MSKKDSINNFFRELFRDTLRTLLVLFKIMIPVSIVVKILQEFGAIVYIGNALYPLMKYTGLPGEMGLVWASAMISNLFGGVIAFISIAAPLHLTMAQVTVVSLMMLVAHTFPIELQIARKSGSRLFMMFCIRFFFAFMMGVLLNFIYSSFDLYQQIAVITLKPDVNINPTIWTWIQGELKNYGIIACFVFSLMLLIKFFKEVGIIDFVTRLLGPVLKVLGIGKDVVAIAIVGLTLGIVYGGALIVNESKEKNIDKRDVFYIMTLMGLCHSVIEDSILMLSLGANYSGIIVFRVILALIITYVIVQITKRLPEKFVNRWIVNKEMK